MGQRRGRLRRDGRALVSYLLHFGTKLTCSKLLYPLMDAPEERIAPNMFHPFTVLDNRLQAGLKGMVRDEQERMRREGPEALNGELMASERLELTIRPTCDSVRFDESTLL